MVLDLCDETHDVMMVVDGGGGSGGVFCNLLSATSMYLSVLQRIYSQSLCVE